MGLKELAASGAGDTLEDKLEMALSHLRSHKDRMDACVLSIGRAMNLIKNGVPELAYQDLGACLNETLKEAKRRTYDNEAALKIAFHGLWDALPSSTKDAALSQIKMLRPDLFQEVGAEVSQ